MNYEAIALWSQVVAAVAFAVIVVVGFIKMITPAINSATAAKNDEIHENERRRDEALRDLEAAREELSRAKTDARSIGERIRHDARVEAQDIIVEARTDADRMIRNARGELARCRAAARDHLRIELIEKALNLARQSASQRIDARVDTMLVDHFISELERGALK